MAQLFAKEGAKVIACDMAELSYQAQDVEYYKLNVTERGRLRSAFQPRQRQIRPH